MKAKKSTITSILCILLGLMFIGGGTTAYAQKRVVFLPWMNLDGRMELDKWEEHYADSIMKAIVAKDPAQTKFIVVPKDSLFAMLKLIKADRKSPQWDSDLWKAARKLKADQVISGNFQLRGDKVLLNAYAYDAVTRMPNKDHEAKDYFTLKSTYLAEVNAMAKDLYPVLVE